MCHRRQNLRTMSTEMTEWSWYHFVETPRAPCTSPKYICSCILANVLKLLPQLVMNAVYKPVPPPTPTPPGVRQAHSSRAPPSDLLRMRQRPFQYGGRRSTRPITSLGGWWHRISPFISSDDEFEQTLLWSCHTYVYMCSALKEKYGSYLYRLHLHFL